MPAIFHYFKNGSHDPPAIFHYCRDFKNGSRNTAAISYYCHVFKNGRRNVPVNVITVEFSKIETKTRQQFLLLSYLNLNACWLSARILQLLVTKCYTHPAIAYILLSGIIYFIYFLYHMCLLFRFRFSSVGKVPILFCFRCCRKT